MDLEHHHAVVGSDPQVTWDRKARTLMESRAYLEEHQRHWDAHGFGMWAAIEQASGTFLGHAGLQYLEGTGDVQVGFYLGRAAWGRGIATETGQAALRYGFEVLGLSHIVAVVRPENHASQKVLTKLSMHEVGMAPHYGFEVQVWRVDAEAYRADATPFKVVD
jgi:ribosomal-protein-alanine N-acetyltransferase